MPSEFFASSSESTPPDSPAHELPPRRHVREHASITSSIETSDGKNSSPVIENDSSTDTLSAKNCHVFGLQPSQKHSASPSTIGSVAVERQQVREVVGMVKAHGESGSHRLRGILQFLGNDDPSPLSSQNPLEENTPNHIIFSDTPPRKIDNSTETNSSGELISSTSRKTPYPSPVLLGEIISKQTKEEADGSYDDDLAEEKNKKSVRLAQNSQSASSSQTVISRATETQTPLAASTTAPAVKGKKLKRAIRRLFRKAKKRPSNSQTSVSSSSSLPLTPTRTDTAPTLPQGGRQEILVNKQLPPLLTGAGPQRDFLPSEATFVPTPMNTPIIGGPLYFDEALSDIQAPTPPTSEFGRPAVYEEEASTTVILTRPLLTQEANVVAPFIKMGENFPAPPTPPIKRKDTYTLDEDEKLPKLDSHGLLGKDGADSFGHKKKGNKRLSTASLKAFLLKPFVKRDRRDLVASVSNEQDKEIAGVGMSKFKPPKRRASFTANIPRHEVKSATPDIRRTSTSVINERRAVFEYVGMGKISSTAQSATPMEHVKEEEGSLVEKSIASAVQADDSSAKADLNTIDSQQKASTPPPPPVQNNFPPLSPSPPPPLERPASTIPTTVRHEKVSSLSEPPIVETEPRHNIRLMMVPLPLLPPKRPGEDSPPTPNPSYASASLHGPASLVTIRSDTRKPYVYHSSPETSTIQPPVTAEGSAATDSAKPSEKSRSSSLSWESGKTTLGTGETAERQARSSDSTSRITPVDEAMVDGEEWEDARVEQDAASASVEEAPAAAIGNKVGERDAEGGTL